MRTVSMVVLTAACVVEPALAQRRGGGARGGGFRGGGGGFARSAARPSVSRPAGGFNRGGFQRPAPPVANRSFGNRQGVAAGDIDRNAIRNNVNNRPVNVGDVNVNRDWDDRWSGCCYNPGAAAAGFVAGAAAAAAVGTVAYAVPPDCIVTVVNGVTYQQCGSTWYQPQFDGTTTTYVVVNPP